MNVNKLVRMANQIADNFAYGGEAKAVASVQDHLSRFWTPDMKQLIVEHCGNGGGGLNKVAAQAVARLAQKQAPA